MSTVTAPILLDSTGQEISAKLQAIADAINGGTIDPLTVTQNGTYTPSGTTLGYGPVTVNVQGGGGGGVVVPKQVNFIDYDGTVLYSYTEQEANDLTALPENPSHDGLVAQGWNWTLAQIKAQLLAAPTGPVWVGQMYVTQSGDTEIDVDMADGRLSPILTLALYGTVTVDWGDGSTADTVTGASGALTDISHTYAASGKYTITIHAVTGAFNLYGGSSSRPLLRKNNTERENIVYSSCVSAIRFGSGITSIGNYALVYCRGLLYATIPNTITAIGTLAFYYCQNMRSVTIPESVTSLDSAFANCYGLETVSVPYAVTDISSAYSACRSLKSVTIPKSVTTLTSSTFYNCDSLSSIVIPDSVTSINNAFNNSVGLLSVIIPDSVTSITNSAFSGCASLRSVNIPDSVTTIGTGAFNTCSCLASVTIPTSVTSIQNNAFYNCYGLKDCHVLPTTPPSGVSTMFSNTPSDFVIYVPSASLETYKTTTGWSSYASKIVGE